MTLLWHAVFTSAAFAFATPLTGAAAPSVGQATPAATPPSVSPSSATAADAKVASAGATAGVVASVKKDDKAQPTTLVPRTPEELAQLSGFFFSVSVGHRLGVGTFVNPAYYSLLTGSLSVSPSYAFSVQGVRLNASAGFGVSYEYTQPNNTNARRMSWSDLSFGLSAPTLWVDKVTGIAVTPGLSLSLPTSLESIHASTIAQLGLSLNASRTFFGKVNLNLGVSGGRGFHSSSVVASRATDARDSQGHLILLCRSGESICDSQGANTAWSLSGRLSVNYFISDHWFAGVGFGLGTSWSYPIVASVDEFSSQALDSNGNPVVRAGYVRSDSMNASIAVGFQPSEHYTISLAVSSNQSPKTMDNRSFRFPFFNVLGPASNSTSIGLGLSASY